MDQPASNRFVKGNRAEPQKDYAYTHIVTDIRVKKNAYIACSDYQVVATSEYFAYAQPVKNDSPSETKYSMRNSCNNQFSYDDNGVKSVSSFSIIGEGKYEYVSVSSDIGWGRGTDVSSELYKSQDRVIVKSHYGDHNYVSVCAGPAPCNNDYMYTLQTNNPLFFVVDVNKIQ